MSTKKDARTLSIRLSTVEANRLGDFENNTGIDAVTLGRRAIEACLNYHDIARSITFPLKLIPATDADIAHISHRNEAAKTPKKKLARKAC